MNFTRKAAFMLSSRSWWMLLAASLGSGWTLSSCTLPSPHLWKKDVSEEPLKALFIPKRQQVALSRAHLRRQIPVAERFDQEGYVFSPHTSPRKLVNVSTFSPGDRVLCPYTLEPFIIPRAPSSSQRPATKVKPPEDSPLQSQPEPLVEPSAVTEPTDGSTASHPAVIEVSERELPPLLPTASSDIPEATWVEGVPGRVYSPFAPRHQQVDVTGLAPGTEVKCPFTGKIFRVPELPPPDAAVAPPLEPAVPLPSSDPEIEPETETPAPPPPVSPMPDVDEKTQEPKQPPPPEEPSSEPAPPRFGAKSDPALPTAEWADDTHTKVQSPFGKPGELVDVSGRAPGEKVICPYTGKPFLVPAP